MSRTGVPNRFRAGGSAAVISATVAAAALSAVPAHAGTATSTTTARASALVVPFSVDSAQLAASASAKTAPGGLADALAQRPTDKPITVVVRDKQGRVVSPEAMRTGVDGPNNVSIGLGWSVYVYLDAGDINWLRGLGYGAATAALCAILTSTIVGAVACAIAAYVVWSIINRPVVLPRGYCQEFKFSYAGALQSTKLVKRSC